VYFAASARGWRTEAEKGGPWGAIGWGVGGSGAQCVRSLVLSNLPVAPSAPCPSEGKPSRRVPSEGSAPRRERSQNGPPSFPSVSHLSLIPLSPSLSDSSSSSLCPSLPSRSDIVIRPSPPAATVAGGLAPKRWLRPDASRHADLWPVGCFSSFVFFSFHLSLSLSWAWSLSAVHLLFIYWQTCVDRFELKPTKHVAPVLSWMFVVLCLLLFIMVSQDTTNAN